MSITLYNRRTILKAGSAALAIPMLESVGRANASVAAPDAFARPTDSSIGMASAAEPALRIVRRL